MAARDIAILIPARMRANRLPGKPMADICGEPMIIHVWRRAMEADLGRVVVATDTTEIAATIEDAGGEALLTRADHKSGSDRIYEAISAIDPDKSIDVIVNLQGDLPTLDPHLVRTCTTALDYENADIATLCAEIKTTHERENSNVVKIVGTQKSPEPSQQKGHHFRALYFTRATAPFGPGPLYHHIGIYAYQRQALERFVSLPPSPLEQREKLEQLRALEAGMRIDVALVDTVPLGVDTPDDLEKARQMLTNSP